MIAGGDRFHPTSTVAEGSGGGDTVHTHEGARISTHDVSLVRHKNKNRFGTAGEEKKHVLRAK